MNKQSCYNCKFIGTLPGSAHSRCNLIRETSQKESGTMELMLAMKQVSLINEETKEELVQLNPHGVKNGWATWPIDFDPIWVERCVFYTENTQN